jgi:hypothetical protein
MMKHFRAENRIRTGEDGSVTILGHPDVTVTCQIQDFSRYGMCIIVEQVIAGGRIVKVEWQDHFLVGRVQHVSAVGGTFQIGLELLHCSKWSEPMTGLLVSRGAARLEKRA